MSTQFRVAATTKGKAATGKQATVTIVTDAGTTHGNPTPLTFEQGGRSEPRDS